jgi:hypothetical protein
MTPGNASVAEGMSQKVPYLSVPEVRCEVIAPLPKLERYDLVHLDKLAHS